MPPCRPVLAATALVLAAPLSLAGEAGPALRPIAPLIGVDVESGDALGYGVAISGGLGLVGAGFQDARGEDSGAAWLFDLADPQSPALIGRLLAADTGPGGLFGHVMHLADGLALIGAIHDDDRGEKAGAVHVFDLSDPAAPSELAQIIAEDTEAGDRFGNGTTRRGDLALIGATGDDDAGEDAGAAWLYDLSDPANPRALSKITGGAEAGSGDGYGHAVVLGEGLALVGASGSDIAAPDGGAVFVHDISVPTAPRLLSLFTADAAQQSAWFGQSVALGDGLAISTAILADIKGEDSGAAYVFDLTDPSHPVQTATLTGSDTVAGDRFGHRVIIEGSTALIGAPGHGEGAGAVYVFDLSDPLAPRETAKLMLTPDQTGGGIGPGLALQGTTALIGAPRLTQGGGAYLFALPETRTD